MSKEDLSQSDLYGRREQTKIKHLILQKYLQRFAMIIGFKWDTITYVDCFSGPWNVQSEDLQDSSFSIALKELQAARAQHGIRRKSIKLRCLFLEKNPSAYAKLKEFADNTKNALVETRNCELQDAVDEIITFVGNGGARSFSFIFIDPTGWTGFAMDEIAPLLRLDPGEALINFMTGHILRFIESPDEMTQESFIKLFGSASFKEKLKGLEKRDREDAAVAEYADNVARTGGFNFTAKAIVLHPQFDRTHFHLIYATRNAKGIEVFKDAEKKAMTEMQQVRAKAHQREQEKRTGQTELFEPKVLHSTDYFDSLRERYLAKAKGQVKQSLQGESRVAYDDAWSLALKEPLVWESDLKKWIAEWKKAGMVAVEGLKPKQRVPQLGEKHFLVWLSTRQE